MKAEMVRGLVTAELEQQLANLRSELFNLRFQQAARQLRNPSRIRQVKRDIARILTIMTERGEQSA
ncbi:MAG: 50S ribosomal protein L29 [Armatimonadetes bacterium]|nr:50S ribosomal protein L29 [Armatimonadota bacterium]NIM24260.1 50S ribosomal protein L29 [Armatimonadota bacterium]NIM68129.1 50S ribosomal protein L29 [Armatimonadota bacterium]NIM76591.1 50S ribosomal protein L29 [Armatimonadota bacterium]NIN06334.1 50S ribosomal protein L29 [Armatimonadota bacterium]